MSRARTSPSNIAGLKVKSTGSRRWRPSLFAAGLP